MIRPLLFFFAFFFALPALRAQTLTVSAAASLQDVLKEIKALHAQRAGGVEIVLNFAGSGALQQQIENGAPVDVFISAAAKQMDALEKKGLLLAGTRRDLLTNTLVLVTPRGMADVETFADLAKAAVKHIAIGDPRSVPVGIYAAEVFHELALEDQLAPKLVRMLDVRQVLTAVETRNADAGVVYLTDARGSEKKVRIAATAPAGSHQAIVYPIAAIDSKQPEAAKAFVTFLSGPAAREVFIKYGFGAAP